MIVSGYINGVMSWKKPFYNWNNYICAEEYFGMPFSEFWQFDRFLGKALGKSGE